MEYNATIELNVPNDLSDRTVDDLMGKLAHFSIAVGASDAGHPELIITVQATTLAQATEVALAVTTQATQLPFLGIYVLPTAEFDRRIGLQPVPELLSVTQTAQILGVSRQRVLQMLSSGRLYGQQVGNTWVIPTAEVEARHERSAA
ncbi:MAG: helix-turn-helix domain-containing protein [Pseudoclavibacter sp.]